MWSSATVSEKKRVNNGLLRPRASHSRCCCLSEGEVKDLINTLSSLQICSTHRWIWADKNAAPSPTTNLAFSAVTDHFNGAAQFDWCTLFLRWSLEVQQRDVSHKRWCIKRRMKSKCNCGVEIVSIPEKEEELKVTLQSFASTWGELFS